MVFIRGQRLFEEIRYKFPLAVVNFQIILPSSINEDIGSVDVCIEQMNGELSKEIEVTVRTSQVGTTATGTFIHVCIRVFLHVHSYCKIHGDMGVYFHI